MLATTSKWFVGAFLGIIIFTPIGVRASGISPASGDIQVDPGSTGTFELSIINNEAENIKYNVDVLGVDIGNSESDLSFYELEPQMREWIELSETSFVLQPEDDEEIVISVHPSADAQSEIVTYGIRVVEESVGAGNLEIGSGFIALLFVTVGDDFEGTFNILDVSSSKKIATGLPISFFLTIENNGERMVQPTGFVVIKNTIGQVVEEIPINPNKKRIPKGQTRTFTIDWKQQGTSLGLMTGIYHIELRVVPWIHGEEFTEELTVTIVPWRTIILLSSIALLFIAILKYSRVFKKQV